MTDLRVLEAIADEMDRSLGLRDAAVGAAPNWPRSGRWTGPVAAPNVAAGSAPDARHPGEAVLASWNMLLDLGRLQDGEPHLARTARRPVARLSANTAAEIGAATAAWSSSPPTAARSACRWRSPTCRTGWSGCR